MDRATVVAVERRVYSREYQEPQHVIEARLRYEDDHYGSLNLGLFAGDNLVGYVLAHLDDGADIPGQAIGDNVYVADMAVLPGYQRHLVRLLTAFAREVRLEYPGLPIVAHAIQETGRAFERAGRQPSPSISAIPPNCRVAQGRTLPVADQVQMLDAPQARTASASHWPARSLIRVLAARPSNPAKAIVMP